MLEQRTTAAGVVTLVVDVVVAVTVVLLVGGGVGLTVVLVAVATVRTSSVPHTFGNTTIESDISGHSSGQA